MNVFQKFGLVLLASLTLTQAHAGEIVSPAEPKNPRSEKYFVEPLICKGKWNKAPKGWHESYEQASLKIISFKSVRAKDCALVDSTSEDVNYAQITGELKVDESLDYIGGWFGPSLYKKGNEVIVLGSRTNEMTLTITGSSTDAKGRQIDTLVGREELYDDYHYDYTCTAVVVKEPVTVINATMKCKLE